MQNTKSSDFSPALVSPSADVLDRVVAIASVPLLPGEKEVDYTNLGASRGSREAGGCDRRTSGPRRH
jgi:hypothetical protein